MSSTCTYVVRRNGTPEHCPKKADYRVVRRGLNVIWQLERGAWQQNNDQSTVGNVLQTPEFCQAHALLVEANRNAHTTPPRQPHTKASTDAQIPT